MVELISYLFVYSYLFFEDSPATLVALFFVLSFFDSILMFFVLSQDVWEKKEVMAAFRHVRSYEEG